MTKMTKNSTVVAGIDVAKSKLDIAIHGDQQTWQVENTPVGWSKLVQLMHRNKVVRIGLEATGGYERDVTKQLRKAGFVVVVFQPLQVRALGEFLKRRAKSDRIDAALIAACVAYQTDVRPPPDPRLAPLADLLTPIEQDEEDIARIKTRLEHARDASLRRTMLADIHRLEKRCAARIRKLAAALRCHDDLAMRLDLVQSIDAIGLRTALAMIIRMPELGSLSREQAAALIGVAPFVHESGKFAGQRRIGGGRKRPRKSLFGAAFSGAMHWNQELIAFYGRLIAAGKPHKVALVACMRKLIIFANTVLARGTPWVGRLADA